MIKISNLGFIRVHEKSAHRSAIAFGAYFNRQQFFTVPPAQSLNEKISSIVTQTSPVEKWDTNSSSKLNKPNQTKAADVLQTSSAPATAAAPLSKYIGLRSPLGRAGTPSKDAFGDGAARIKVDGREYTLHPNALGGFQQIYIKAGDKVSVEVVCAQGTTGQPISVEVEDGGQIEKQMGLIKPLPADDTLPFVFQAGTNDGIYRIRLRAGDSYRQLNFWVGRQT